MFDIKWFRRAKNRYELMSDNYLMFLEIPVVPKYKFKEGIWQVKYKNQKFDEDRYALFLDVLDQEELYEPIFPPATYVKKRIAFKCHLSIDSDTFDQAMDWINGIQDEKENKKLFRAGSYVIIKGLRLKMVVEADNVY